MKQTLKTLIRNVKSINGNSLAEFATVTALMATLAATAAPKLSEMSEGAKAQKSVDELDKLVKQAGQFYQDTADIEGRGRFPGQDKYDMKVGGHSNELTITTQIIGVEEGIGGNPAAADPTYTNYQHANGSDWVSVFGKDNLDFPKSTAINESIANKESRELDVGIFSNTAWLFFSFSINRMPQLKNKEVRHINIICNTLCSVIDCIEN